MSNEVRNHSLCSDDWLALWLLESREELKAFARMGSICFKVSEWEESELFFSLFSESLSEFVC